MLQKRIRGKTLKLIKKKKKKKKKPVQHLSEAISTSQTSI